MSVRFEKMKQGTQVLAGIPSLGGMSADLGIPIPELVDNLASGNVAVAYESLNFDREQAVAEGKSNLAATLAARAKAGELDGKVSSDPAKEITHHINKTFDALLANLDKAPSSEVAEMMGKVKPGVKVKSTEIEIK